MKKLIIVLFIIGSTSSYSQTKQQELSSHKIDCFGKTIQNDSLKQKLFHDQIIIQSTMKYDSVRALTEINDSAHADAYPWISPNGLRMYFIRGVGGTGIGNTQLMFTDRANTNTYFNSPVVVPIGISNPKSCWFSNDELEVYLCQDSSLYYVNRLTTSSPFNSPVYINLNGYSPFKVATGPSLNAAQNDLFLSLFKLNTSAIVEFTRTSSTSFSYVRTLSPPAGYSTGTGQLAKDELNYFFSASFNGGNTILYQITRTTPSDSFNLNLIQQIQGINDTIIPFNVEPSMTDSLNWVVFVRNNTGFWEGNDLYIAQQDIISSVFHTDSKAFPFSIFPNPTSGQFIITFNKVIAKGVIEISNVIGENIFKENIFNESRKEITVKDISQGIYLAKVFDGEKMFTQKIIIQ